MAESKKPDPTATTNPGVIPESLPQGVSTVEVETVGDQVAPVVPMSAEEIKARGQEPSKKPDVLHLQKFMNGRMTPQEVHRKLTYFGKTCTGCGSKKVALRIKAFAPIEWLERSSQGGAFLLMLAAQHGGRIPVAEFIYGPFVRISDVYACDNCKRHAEKAAAKHPSSWIIEFDRGPSAEKKVIGVPASIH